MFNKKKIRELNKEVMYQKLIQLSQLFREYGLSVDTLNRSWSRYQPAIMFSDNALVDELLQETLELDLYLIGKFTTITSNSYMDKIEKKHWFDYYNTTNERIEHDIKVMKELFGY